MRKCCVRGLVALLGVTLVAAVSVGCKNRPAADDRRALTQEERDAMRFKPLGEGDPDAANETMTIAVVHRLAVPLDRPTADAWSLVDEAIFPPVTRAVWHNNGMRVGMMDGYKIARFADALPGTLGISRTNRLVTDVPSPLITAPRQPGALVVDLTIPPRAVREEVFDRGTTQLLAQMRAVPLGIADQRVLRVRLIPHQHVPKVSLTPRQPLDKALDGRVFEELALTVDLPQDQMLVLGLYREPVPDVGPESDPSGEEVEPSDDLQARGDALISAAPADQPVDPPGEREQGDSPEATEDGEEVSPDKPAEDDDAVRYPPLEPNFGRALFAGQTLGRPVQYLLLISVETVESGVRATDEGSAADGPAGD